MIVINCSIQIPYLGQKTAEIIEYYLKSQGLTVDSYSPKDLKTSNLEEFHIALSDLVKDLSEELDGYRNSGYKIVFILRRLLRSYAFSTSASLSSEVFEF